jgi:hypothetical protein
MKSGLDKKCNISLSETGYIYHPDWISFVGSKLPTNLGSKLVVVSITKFQVIVNIGDHCFVLLQIFITLALTSLINKIEINNDLSMNTKF